VTFSDFSWLGLFFLFDRKLFLSLIFLTIFILIVVLVSSLSMLRKVLSLLLGFVCGLFFSSNSYFFLYFTFELALFPIIFLILMDGAQIEKISASSYLIIYAIFFSLPLFLVIFTLERWSFNYFTIFIS